MYGPFHYFPALIGDDADCTFYAYVLNDCSMSYMLIFPLGFWGGAK